MNTKIITVLVVGIALVGFTGAASADVIFGSAQYEYYSGGTIFDTGSADWASGMNLDLTVDTNVVAESDIDNYMLLALEQHPEEVYALVGAMQYGGNSIALNNGQEPGPFPEIWDFVSTSFSGGAVEYVSEGVYDAVFVAESHSSETTGPEDFLMHDVVLTDTNLVYGTASPTIDPCVDPVVHIKEGSFSWDCLDDAMVKFENSRVKEAYIGSGIQTGGYAFAELDPEALDWNGPAAAVTVEVGGLQTVVIELIP